MIAILGLLAAALFAGNAKEFDDEAGFVLQPRVGIRYQAGWLNLHLATGLGISIGRWRSGVRGNGPGNPFGQSGQLLCHRRSGTLDRRRVPVVVPPDRQLLTWQVALVEPHGQTAPQGP